MESNGYLRMGSELVTFIDDTLDRTQSIVDVLTINEECRPSAIFTEYLKKVGSVQGRAIVEGEGNRSWNDAVGDERPKNNIGGLYANREVPNCRVRRRL